MALFTRIFSKSNKLVYGSQVLLQKEYAVPVRHFAKDSAPPPKGPAKKDLVQPGKDSNLPELIGDKMLKSIFSELKTKFESAMGVLKKEKITIDPDDPAAVAQYAQVMKTVREKAGLLSESDSLKEMIEMETKDIPDVRTYLLTSNEICIKDGIRDELGAHDMLMAALEKVEKQIKKPLMRDDDKGMDLFLAEYAKVTEKLGVRYEDLPKLEEELELKIAKAQLEELKKETLEAMETQLKREEFKDEEKTDPKNLDIRNFI